MNCPEHPDVKLRREYTHDGYTGFCAKCCKHYKMCTAAHYTEGCVLLKGHDGKHKDHRGDEWENG